MLFHIFIAVAVFFLKTEAKTLFVIDIGTVYRLDNKTLAKYSLGTCLPGNV